MASQKIVDTLFVGFLGRFNVSIGVMLFYFLFYLPYAILFLVIAYSFLTYGSLSVDDIYRDIYFSSMISYATFMVFFGSITTYYKFRKKLIISNNIIKKVDFRFFEGTLIVSCILSLSFLVT